ncbi:MAG TPA: rhomboid family intramembrane serine protease [Solirubrobacteraceae bacterium]
MPSRTTASGVPIVTRALIAINVVVFVVETASGAPLGGGGGGSVWYHGLLFGPFITQSHDYWRLLTAGFLHDGLFHILVNMISLYWVGMMLEPAIGSVNFAAVYFASLLAGSFGALLFTPGYPSVGASGAIFGIFGALIVLAWRRGIPLWQSGLGFVLVLNLIISISFRGISIGAHLGGLIAGVICGFLIVELAERRRSQWLALLGCGAVAVASVVGAIAVAGGPGLAPNGIGFA